MAGGAEVWAAGWAALRSGQPAEAERMSRQALATDPHSAEGWLLLGTARHRQGWPSEAEECFRRALALRSDLLEAWFNLGAALQDQRRPSEAVECFAQVLRTLPDLPEAHLNLGTALQEQGRTAEAVESFRRALELRSDFPEAHYNLGNALRCLGGQPAEAEEYYRRALALRPDYAVALNNLGSLLREQGRPAEAEEYLRRALALRPDLPEALANLGSALRESGRPAEAEVHLRRALTLRPDLPEAYNHLGLALRDMGQLDEAEQHLRRALALQPGSAVIHNGLLLTLHYKAGITLPELAAEHTEFQRRHAAPLRAAWKAYDNDRDPERPLRLGFVSADFGRHPIGFLLVRVAEALTRRPSAGVYYSDRRSPPDEWTRRFRASSALWRETATLSDERFAELVRADSIDVLIDLAGHTANNRLLVFARRPAPVQATWLGYPGTTGLEAIDYLIADVHQVPPDAEVHYRERVLRLPSGYASYDPPAQVPEPGPLPSLRTGRVTFGCFNNPAKLSPPAVAAFAAVLQRVPGSRLLLKYSGLDDPTVGHRWRERFAAAGLESGRLDVRGATEHLEHLAAYREVDVALDPFPYGGGLTTCEALWMGVPVVTLPQETFASRHSLSYLSVVGLAEELVAWTRDKYVARAVELAHDWDRLAELRAGLRQRVARSPLCDGERLADELLMVLRSAWRAWVAGGGLANN